MKWLAVALLGAALIGCRGAAGIPGEVGTPGDEGAAGEVGMQGPPGAPGAAGPAGAPGAPGPAGPQGAPGIDALDSRDATIEGPVGGDEMLHDAAWHFRGGRGVLTYSAAVTVMGDYSIAGPDPSGLLTITRLWDRGDATVVTLTAVDEDGFDERATLTILPGPGPAPTDGPGTPGEPGPSAPGSPAGPSTPGEPGADPPAPPPSGGLMTEAECRAAWGGGSSGGVPGAICGCGCNPGGCTFLTMQWRRETGGNTYECSPGTSGCVLMCAA